MSEHSERHLMGVITHHKCGTIWMKKIILGLSRLLEAPVIGVWKNISINRIPSNGDATRSDRQNNAMHLWFRQIAEQLNDAGYWVRHPFSDSFEIPFTEVLVKEMLYKPTVKAMFNKGTTTKLTPSELSEAAEVLVRWLSEHKGVYVPFPQQLKDQLK